MHPQKGTPCGQKAGPAFSGLGAPRGAGAASRLALPTRGGAEVTCKAQQVTMQRLDPTISSPNPLALGTASHTD